MDAADDLYALPPDEFTAARNALAKRLKAEGDKDAAAAVATLRRPSVGAWALNQVAREDPDLIDEALVAGEALRAASDAAAAGDASELRAATAAERTAAQAVVKAARPHLGARGEALTPGLLATLRVAALDAEVADQLRRGVLTAEHEQAGFGFGLDGPAVPSRGSAPTARATSKAKATGRRRLEAVPDPEPDPAAVEQRKAERAEARAAERARAKERKAAEQRARRLAKEATRLAKEADEAEAAAVAAREVADEAAERATDAQRAADELAE